MNCDKKHLVGATKKKDRKQQQLKTRPQRARDIQADRAESPTLPEDHRDSEEIPATLEVYLDGEEKLAMPESHLGREGIPAMLKTQVRAEEKVAMLDDHLDR